MKQSLTDKAYELIRNDIISCTLEPGKRIAQTEFAEMYDIGKTPVREALQRLVNEGYIELIPRYGYSVMPITINDVHELFEARLIIESATARFAAERASELQLKEILQLSNFTYRHSDKTSYVDFLEKNTEFHNLIARASGNRRLTDILSKILDELTRVFHLGLDIRDSAEEMRDEHIALAGTLCERNSDRAEELARSQIIRSKERILDAIILRNINIEA